MARNTKQLIGLILLTLSVGIGTATHKAFSRPAAQPQQYIIAEYWRVPPEHVPDYIAVESRILRAIREREIERQNLRAWYLYRVRVPAADYNFVTLRFLDSLGNSGALTADMEGIDSPLRKGELESMRRNVKTEIWGLVESIGSR